MGGGSYGEKNRGSLPPSRSRAVTETSNRFLMPVRLSVRRDQNNTKLNHHHALLVRSSPKSLSRRI
jgi:hypothetical protein